ncbi:uncharacterized protein LOC144885728 isoform X1 [Branchiostoma floridae x Branchiostoma japonicum]
MGAFLLATILLLVGSSMGQDCVDDNASCAGWAADGECDLNPGYMLTNCRLSCGECTTDCVDDNAGCPGWAADGECDNNPGYMLTNCRLSCGECTTGLDAMILGAPTTAAPIPTSYPGVPCVDEDQNCAGWAAEGQCQTNRYRMYRTCRATCGICDGSVVCEDMSPFCPLWASYGRCGSGSDGDWMLNTCPLSCGLCEFDCWSSPCQNGGTCNELYGPDGYSCSCGYYPALYTGRNCETNIDDCQNTPFGSNTPCYNGGTCVDGLDSYSCLCPQGTYGRLCDSDCVVGDGSNYRGDLRSVSNGQWCGYWFRGREGYSPEAFPDAGLDRNFCRNPDGSPEGPFCITHLFEDKVACEVATCDCYVDGTTSYRGQVNVTGTGQQCLDWADEMVQMSLGFMGLSEAQIAAAGLDGNYCRDPTGSGTLECFVAPGGGLFGIVFQEACRIDECSTQYYVPTPVTCYSCAADEDCDQDQDDLVTGGGESRETLCENGACWISWKTSTDGKYGGHIRSCQHEDLVCTQEYMQETCTEDGNTKECLKCCQADRCNGELLQGSISAGARASVPNMVMLLAFLAAMFCSRS